MTLMQHTQNWMVVLHRWTGLLIAVFLIIVGLTGSMLAFRGPIDGLVNPGMHVSAAPGQKPLPLAALAEKAEHLNPHLRAGFFAVEHDQVVFHMAMRTDPATGKAYPQEMDMHITLNPYTGEKLTCGPASDPNRGCFDLMGFIYDLHTSLTTRTQWGWSFVGAVALIWTIDCLVAFCVTLPRGTGPFWKRWQQAWRVKWRASATRINFDLHRATGLWLWPLLFIFGWSSVMLGLRQVYEPVMKATFDYVSDDEGMARMMVPKPIENPKLTWHDTQMIGERAMAESAEEHHYSIERPYGMAYIPEYGAYTYGVRSSMDLRGHGWDTTVLIDGNSGAVREIDLPRGQHIGNTISTLLWGIHYGDLRDWLPFRIMICLFGVLLATLSYTGIAIWWRKRKARRLVLAMRSAMLVMLLLGFAAGSARAQPTLPSLTPDQLARIRKIEGRLMAPCCYTQTIRDHDSQVAVDMRNEVTAFVASGKSEQDIITYYRTKYGETILVVPDGMSGGLLTVTPVMVFVASTGLLLFLIRRSVSARDVSIPQLLVDKPEIERLAIQEKIRAEIGEGW